MARSGILLRGSRPLGVPVSSKIWPIQLQSTLAGACRHFSPLQALFQAEKTQILGQNGPVLAHFL